VLILSRRNGESLIIGEDIKITVLSQRSNQVRIGIEAPRSLPVHREEVLLRNQQADSSLHNSNEKREKASLKSATTEAQTTAEKN